MSTEASQAAPMDDRVAAWVIEFLLRQPCVDDSAAASILEVLPVPDDDAVRLAVVLRSLRREISLPSLSTRILVLIESFMETHGSKESELLEAARAAYVAVAVEAVAKYLRKEPPDMEKLLLGVERVWGKKKEGTRLAARWLATEEMVRSRRELLSAIGNEMVRDEVVRRDTKAVAVKVVVAFLESAERELGPPFLVSLSVAMAENLCQMDNEVVSPVTAALNDKKDEIPSGFDAAVGDMNHAEKNMNPSLAAKTVVEENPASVSTLSIGEVKRALEELNSNANDLKSLTDDLLPTLLGIADNMVKQHTKGQPSKSDAGELNHISGRDEQITPLMATGETFHKTSTTANENQTHQNAAKFDKPDLTARTSQTSTANENQTHQNAAKFDKPDPTARTYQWSDNSNSKDSPPRDPSLPSPRKMAVSRQNLGDNQKFMRKRTLKRWSAAEEDALRSAVREYGRGNWKLLLTKNREVFVDRTQTDLKDKWRNMTR